MDTGSYEFWATIEEMGSPFNKEPMTEDSVFLWEEIVSPMTPDFFQVGQWGIFPDAKSLGGYILHKFFLFAFENWLVREEWDNSEKIDVIELLRRAKKSGKCSYSKDIPLMEKITKLTEQTLEEQTGWSLFDSLRKISSLFNDKWKSTGTWSFSIDLFDDTQSVGLAVDSRYEDKDFHYSFDISKTEWRRICSDINNQDAFKEILLNILF